VLATVPLFIADAQRAEPKPATPPVRTTSSAKARVAWTLELLCTASTEQTSDTVSAHRNVQRARVVQDATCALWWSNAT
jgi:hypothetical protein